MRKETKNASAEYYGSGFDSGSSNNGSGSSSSDGSGSNLSGIKSEKERNVE